MKLRIEGTPDELRSKGPELVKALAARLGVDLVALVHSDPLEKAWHGPVVVSHYGPIQELVKRSTKVYDEEIATMLKEIDQILDQAAKE